MKIVIETSIAIQAALISDHLKAIKFPSGHS
jgi:hypothetical protein